MTDPILDDDAPGTRVPDDRAYGQAVVLATQGNHGSIFFYQQAPSYRIRPFPTGPEPLAPGADRRPSVLLDARRRVVPFTGRGRELATLARWRDDPQVDVGLHLLHGAAGQGKSRLAARFADLSRDAGWRVSEVSHGTRLVPPAGGAEPGRPRGHLLVVDHAERWPLRHLLHLLVDRQLHTGDARLRFLLLSRPAGPWWRSLSACAQLELGLRGSETQLLPLAGGADERRELFNTARIRFGQLLGAPAVPGAHARGGPDTPSTLDLLGPAGGPEAGPEATPETGPEAGPEATPETGPEAGPEARPEGTVGSTAVGDQYSGGPESVLTVHMRALTAAYAALDGAGRPPRSPDALSAYLLAREREHWLLMHANGRIRSRPALIGRLVFTSVLVGTAGHDEALGILRRTRLAGSDGGAAALLDDHGRCYPARDPAAVLEPLVPERLAEDLVALQIPGHAVTSHPADPWARGVAGLLLRREVDDRRLERRRLRRILGVLIDAGQRWPHLARTELYPVLRERPNLVFAAGGPTLSALVSMPAVDVELLDRLAGAAPAEPEIDLDPGLAQLTQRLVTARLRTARDPADRAALYDQLGLGLLRPGHHRQAGAAFAAAVRWRRALARGGDPQQRHLLARSLSRLGITQGELGRWHVARHALVEALRIWDGLEREPAAEPPTDLAVDRAGCWEWLAIVLDQLGQPDRAVAARNRATRILRRLAAADAACARRLAENLRDMAEQLRCSGRLPEALARVEEALPMWRRLTRTRPAYQPGYAALLLIRGRILHPLGRRAEGLADVGRALKLLRAISRRAVSHDALLADALAVQAHLYAAERRTRDAVPVLAQALAIKRRLAGIDPAGHRAGLAELLLTFARACLAARCRLDDALGAAVQACAVYWQLAERVRPHRASLLLGAQECVVALLVALGRQAEADQLQRLLDVRGAAHRGAASARPRPGARPAPEPAPAAVVGEEAVGRLLARGDYPAASRALNGLPPLPAALFVSRQGPTVLSGLRKNGLNRQLATAAVILLNPGDRQRYQELTGENLIPDIATDDWPQVLFR